MRALFIAGRAEAAFEVWAGTSGLGFGVQGLGGQALESASLSGSAFTTSATVLMTLIVARMATSVLDCRQYTGVVMCCARNASNM